MISLSPTAFLVFTDSLFYAQKLFAPIWDWSEDKTPHVCLLYCVFVWETNRFAVIVIWLKLLGLAETSSLASTVGQPCEWVFTSGLIRKNLIVSTGVFKRNSYPRAQRYSSWRMYCEMPVRVVFGGNYLCVFWQQHGGEHDIGAKVTYIAVPDWLRNDNL